jgi:hypothetical protein
MDTVVQKIPKPSKSTIEEALLKGSAKLFVVD